MSTLVDELLVLARLDQVRPLETEPVDLARLAATPPRTPTRSSPSAACR